ncbi:MAG: hypothetical protein R3A44_06290 [Caldilineaceae bacterium]
MRQIGQELRHSYWTIRDALAEAAPRQYRLSKPRAAPVLGPYKGRIDELLAESEKQPRKQRIRRDSSTVAAGRLPGSELVSAPLWSQQRQGRRRPPVYLPLSFEPGGGWAGGLGSHGDVGGDGGDGAARVAAVPFAQDICDGVS